MPQQIFLQVLVRAVIYIVHGIRLYPKCATLKIKNKSICTKPGSISLRAPREGPQTTVLLSCRLGWVQWAHLITMPHALNIVTAIDQATGRESVVTRGSGTKTLGRKRRASKASLEEAVSKKKREEGKRQGF